MPRGQKAADGTESVNANGYTQVKVKDRGWVGKHVLILENKLGRRLVPGERATFADGNHRNLDPSNIVLTKVSSNSSIEARIARLKGEVQDRLEWIELLERQLNESR